MSVHSKWFHHVGTFKIRKRKNGDLRLHIRDSPMCLGKGNEASLTDSHVKDVFVWLGRYLAIKGKLPKHLALEEIAVRSNRTTKAIRSVVANEVYNDVGRSQRTAAGEKK